MSEPTDHDVETAEALYERVSWEQPKLAVVAAIAAALAAERAKARAPFLALADELDQRRDDNLEESLTHPDDGGSLPNRSAWIGCATGYQRSAEAIRRAAADPS